MRICFFGDSFVNGFGDPAYQGWVGRLCAAAYARGSRVTAYNCGVRRATSEDVRASWLAEALFRLPPEHKAAVVFSFGANDRTLEAGRPRVSPDRQLENTRAVLTEARHRWPVLFITPPRPAGDGDGEDAAARVAGLLAVCADLNILARRLCGLAHLQALGA